VGGGGQLTPLEGAVRAAGGQPRSPGRPRGAGGGSWEAFPGPRGQLGLPGGQFGLRGGQLAILEGPRRAVRGLGRQLRSPEELWGVVRVPGGQLGVWRAPEKPRNAMGGQLEPQRGS